MLSKKQYNTIIKKFPGLKFSSLSATPTTSDRSFLISLSVREKKIIHDKEYFLVGYLPFSFPEKIAENQPVNFELSYLQWQCYYEKGSEQWNDAWDKNLPTYEISPFEITTEAEQALFDNFKILYEEEETIARLMFLLGVSFDDSNNIILPPRRKM